MSKQVFQSELFRKLVFIAGIIFCLSPFASPPVGLVLGFLLSQLIGNPFQSKTPKATKLLLQICVVGLGFGMNLTEAAKAGREGFAFTVASIGLTLLLGILAGKFFKIDKKITFLISVGTAICGGSAIAAISPIIEAEEEQMSVSLGTVFILNAIALFIFPVIGTCLAMAQSDFGLWVAIAIHDTSSVVGAAQKYGVEALQIATTIKLERALWIIPVSFITAIVFKSKASKINIPYFIFLFILAMTLNTYIPQLHEAGQIIVTCAKRGMIVTLFLIGIGLSREALKRVGWKPLLLGVLLWIFISLGSLAVICHLGN